MTNEMLNIKQLTKMLKCSHMTIYNQMNKGQFPRPVRVSNKVVRWPSSTIQKWLQARNKCIDNQIKTQEKEIEKIIENSRRRDITEQIFKYRQI